MPFVRLREKKNGNVWNNFFLIFLSFFIGQLTILLTTESLCKRSQGSLIKKTKNFIWQHACEIPNNIAQCLPVDEYVWGSLLCENNNLIKTHKPCLFTSPHRRWTVFTILRADPLIQVFRHPSNTITRLNIVSDYSWVSHTYAWASVLHTLDAQQLFPCTLTSSFSSSV